jgi:Raf kinase inhibitor-like YbhB/YbcL family protein
MLGNLWRKLSASFSIPRRLNFSRGSLPKGKRSRPGRFRPTVEALEDRTLASVTLTSPDFRNGRPIPLEFAAGRPDPTTGRRPFPNESPPLEMRGPLDTKSFALIMYDETAGNYTHWVIFNIPVTMSLTPSGLVADGSLRRNIDKVPEPFGREGVQGLNGNGVADLLGDPSQGIPPQNVSEITAAGGFGYLGPAPSDRVEHRYIFRLYALSTARLRLPVTVNANELRQAMGPHILGAVNLTGTFTNLLP